MQLLHSHRVEQSNSESGRSETEKHEIEHLSRENEHVRVDSEFLQTR